MDLKEFVAKTLVQIVEGVQEAQDQMKDSSAKINPKIGNHGHRIQEVDFDVALTASEEAGHSGGIRVAWIGGEAKSATTEGSVSRIKFTVPIVLPRNSS